MYKCVCVCVFYVFDFFYLSSGGVCGVCGDEGLESERDVVLGSGLLPLLLLLLVVAKEVEG